MTTSSGKRVEFVEPRRPSSDPRRQIAQIADFLAAQTNRPKRRVVERGDGARAGIALPGNNATKRLKIVAAAFVESCWLTMAPVSARQMIGPLPLGHAAGADPLDRGAEHRIAAHQQPPRTLVSFRSQRVNHVIIVVAMETSDVRRRVTETIQRARRHTVERRERTDAAARDFPDFLERVATPLFRQVAGVLKAEGYPFSVFTPGGLIRLMSDRASDDFIELSLDTSGERPAVMGHSRRARGHRIIEAERPVAEGEIREIGEEEVLRFLLEELEPSSSARAPSWSRYSRTSSTSL